MALARYEGVAVNLAGDVIPNATVEVRRDQPGRPVVPLWADRNGTVPLGNPITTDAEGKFGFHVTGGSYYVRIFTGPSQQPLQQYVRRYQAIGTAAERDVEDLATALEAGTATFPTLAELEAFIPAAEGVGGKVTTGEDAGFYHYDMDEEEWVFDRPLFDTLARMVVTGGTADAIEAETATGVADSAVVMLWIEAPGDNTGSVTINGKEVLTASGNSLIAGQWNEGRTYWFSDEGANYKLRTESDVDGIATQVEIWANETLNNKNYAEEWAQSENPISVEAGGDSVNDKSSKAWAGESAASAAEAAGYAAGVNLPPILPSDAGKQLFVNDEEDGYDLRDPSTGIFATLALAAASAPSADPEYYDIAYFDTDYVPGSGCKWRKVASDPGHLGAFQNANGTWYEINHPTKPQQLGAKGDGTDETAKLQTLFDLSIGRPIMAGLEAEYTVKSIFLHSRQWVCGLRLKTLAGSEDHVAPITIDGLTTPKESILLENVWVDGNRQNQTDIAGGEDADGARHAFYIAGRVSNVRLRGCKGSFAATDGLALFDGGNNPFPAITDVLVEDCEFFWNRRHGSAQDNARGVHFVRAKLSANGRDLDDVSPLDSGMRGARYTGDLYGNGVDAESYGTGTHVEDFSFIDCTMLSNYGSGLKALPSASGYGDEDWLPFSGINVIGGRYDSGVAPMNAAIGSIQLGSEGPFSAGQFCIEDVTISGVTCLNSISANNVKQLRFQGVIESVSSPFAYHAFLSKCVDAYLDIDAPASVAIYNDNSTVTRTTKLTGYLAPALVAGASASIVSQSSTLVSSSPDSGQTYRINARLQVSGGPTATALYTFSGSRTLVRVEGTAISSVDNSGVPVPYESQNQRLLFRPGNNDAYDATIYVTVF